MNDYDLITDDPLLKTLVESTPQANPEFQRQLEDRLMLELRTPVENHRSEKIMIQVQNPPPRPLSKLPFTLAAAVLALILVGSILVFRPNPSSQPIMGAQAMDEPISSQSSFEYGGQVFNPSNQQTISAMQRAGMTWMKYQMMYSDVVDNPQKIIDAAHSAGFKILLTVQGDPDRLNQADYVNSYAKWLADASLMGADAIEVWAEPNIDQNWPSGEISGAAYVDLLRRAYEAIKIANPGTLVISAAPAPTGAESAFPGQVVNDDRWLREVVENGGLDYLDCVGAQYVDGVVPPGKQNGDPRDNTYTRYLGGMVIAYRELTQDQKPLCFTSLGYLSDDGLPPLPAPFAWAENITIGQQAAWLGEALRLAAVSGKIHLAIIWNVDFTRYDDMPYAGYAILRPYGSCPACDALEVFSLDSTLIPSPGLQPVVIARYDLAAGTQLDRNMFTTAYWPIDIIPVDSVTRVDSINRQFLQKDIARWQPILQQEISSQSSVTNSSFQIKPQPNATWTFQIDLENVSAGRVIVSIPIAPLQDTQTERLQAGDQVTILASMSFVQIDGKLIPVPLDAQSQNAVTQARITQETTFVAIETTATRDRLRVTSRPADAITLQWMIEAKLPIILVVNQDNPGN